MDTIQQYCHTRNNTILNIDFVGIVLFDRIVVLRSLTVRSISFIIMNLGFPKDNINLDELFYTKILNTNNNLIYLIFSWQSSVVDANKKLV